MRSLRSVKITLEIDSNKDTTHKEFGSLREFLQYLSDNSDAREDLGDFDEDGGEAAVMGLTQDEVDALYYILKDTPQNIRGGLLNNLNVKSKLRLVWAEILESLDTVVEKLNDHVSPKTWDDGSADNGKGKAN